MQDPTDSTTVPVGAHPARQLEEIGYGSALVRVEPGGKRPLYTGWQVPGSTTAEEIERTGANVGLLAAGLPGLDIDVDDPELAEAIRAFAADTLPGFSDAPVRLSRDPRSLHAFRAEEPFGKIQLTIENPDDPDSPYGVEWLAEGQQYVIHGPHSSGAAYRWEGPALWEIPPTDLPTITREQAADFRDALAEHLEGLGNTVHQQGSGSVSEPATEEALAAVAAPGDTPEERQRWADEVADVLKEDERYGDYSAWQTLLRILRQAYGPELEAEALAKAIELSETFPNYDGPEAVEKKWNQLGEDRAPMGFPVLLHRARERGYTVPAELLLHDLGLNPEDGLAPSDNGSGEKLIKLAERISKADATEWPRFLRAYFGRLRREAEPARLDLADKILLVNLGDKLGREGAKDTFRQYEAGLAGRPRYSLAPIPVGALLDAPAEPTRWVWDRTLPEGALSILAGKPKTGKTTLIRALAVAVSEGRQILDRDTAAGPVVYLSLEDPEALTREEFRRLGPEGGALSIYSGAAPKDPLPEVRALAEGAALLIVDTMQKLLRVESLNAYEDVVAALEPYSIIAKETGCHILFSHHSPKGETADIGDAILGSVGLLGAVDVGIVLMRDTNSHQRFIGTRQRQGEDIDPPHLLTLDPDTHWPEIGETRQAAQQKAETREILAVLGDTDGLREEDIADRVTMTTTVFRRALRRAHRTGVIDREGRGVRGDPYTYRVPELGEEFRSEYENLTGEVEGQEGY